jgi:hypothetical protein
MNAERLLLVAKQLRAEFAKTNLVQSMQSLVNGIQNLAQQAGNPQFQTLLANNLTQLRQVLENSSTDEFSPAWRQIVTDIGGTGLHGTALLERIERAFSANQMTPAAALTEMRQLQEQVSAFSTAITKTVEGLEGLRIEAEDLEPGDAEIGVSIPRELFNSELSQFADELRRFDFVLRIFSEIVTGEFHPSQITVLSSSDLMVFVSALPVIAAAVSHALDKLISTYKGILEVREMHSKLKAQGVSDERLRGIEEHANEAMEKVVEELVAEFKQKYLKASDAGRRNELLAALAFSLNRLSNDIDKGYNFEVRVLPPPSSEETDPELSIAIQTIKDSAKTLEFIRLMGPRILSLPEPEAEVKAHSEPAIEGEGGSLQRRRGTKRRT